MAAAPLVLPVSVPRSSISGNSESTVVQQQPQKQQQQQQQQSATSCATSSVQARAEFHWGNLYGGWARPCRGRYGVVYRVVERKTQNRVVLKLLSLIKDDPEADDATDDETEQNDATEMSDAPKTTTIGGTSMELFNRELGCLEALSHAGIVSLIRYHICAEDQIAAFVFEELSYDLYDILYQGMSCSSFTIAYRYSWVNRPMLHPIAEAKIQTEYPAPIPFAYLHVRCWMSQLAHALAHAHQSQIFHRDLKPQNLLLSEDCHTIKIADWGMAKECGVGENLHTPAVCTLWYRAPELLLGTRESKRSYKQAMDMWALGCLFFEMVTRQPLFAQAIDPLCADQKTLFPQLLRPNQTEMSMVTDIYDEMGGRHPDLVYFPERAHRKLALFKHLTKEEWPEAYSVLLKLLDINPATRMTAVTLAAFSSMPDSKHSGNLRTHPGVTLLTATPTIVHSQARETVFGINTTIKATTVNSATGLPANAVKPL